MSNTVEPGRRSGRLLSYLMVLLVLTLGIGIGTLISYRVGATGAGESQIEVARGGQPVVAGSALALSDAFKEAASLVESAVVNINTEEVVRRRSRSQTPGADPLEDWFRRFMPEMPENFTRRSLGSGVIVDRQGFIITNNHVVAGASKIKVGLKSGQEYRGRIISSDEYSDIAVIKIDANEDLPFAKIGDAEALKVGDWVLAIGSPFGLEQTVTAGIISATGRVFDTPNRSTLFNDYLQTDAAINPGNSGGPLVSLNGAVVGINTFISTTTRSNAGVGFAVPSHIFVNVYNQILNQGEVTRGWLGVNMNFLPNADSFTREMAKYFGVKQSGGVLITGLSDADGKASSTGPAAKAGVRPEDVVIEFNGQSILAVHDLRSAVANTTPGSTVSMKVVRKGIEKELEVTVGKRTLEEQNPGAFTFEEPAKEPKPEIGLTFDDVPARLARELDVPGGAVVTEVAPGSLSEEAGLVGGNQGVMDVIVEANGHKIESARDLVNLFRPLKSGDAVVLKFLRYYSSGQGGSSTFYTSIMKP